MCPIYEYYCDTCSSIKEVIHKINEELEVKCDKCITQTAMTKIVSVSGFILNGAGFYQNDYKLPKNLGGKDG